MHNLMVEDQVATSLLHTLCGVRQVYIDHAAVGIIITPKNLLFTGTNAKRGTCGS